MHIITGTARGRKLIAPEGNKIRPTTAMVKEAICNIIQFDIPGRRVLDLFAGTGQLGLECLSRGAASCDFVDGSKAATRLIKENLTRTGLPGGTVYQRDAIAFVRQAKQYDLILIDPPYDYSFFGRLILTIAEFDILSKNGIMMCETEQGTVLPQLDLPYKQGKEYRYGKVKIALYTRVSEGILL